MMDEASDGFGVSVIIPARNAATTIAATLDSLLAQSYLSWQSVVVDDGSSDATGEIATAYAARDARISVLRGPRRGVGAARNLGLKASTAPWVLFLDADDMIAPHMLASMVASLRTHPDAEAAHCGWVFTNSDGTPIGSKRCEATSPDLFPYFASYCAFVMHACVIRREQLQKIGGFDESLHTSEDFDLWQRLARIGTRFTGISDCLSIYRLRPNATWFKAGPFLDDVLGVVRRGHGDDSRLPDALVLAKYRNGAPARELPAVEVRMMTWASAIAIAREEDTIPLLNRIEYPPDSPLDPRAIVDTLFQAVPLALCRPASAWRELLPRLGPAITQFLEGLSERAATPNLALRAQRELETRIAAVALEDADDSGTAMIFGGTAALAIDITAPVTDIHLGNVDRVVCTVRVDNQVLGSILLPVADGVVPGLVLADAIAGSFAWTLLKIFFERQQIYAQVSVEHGADSWRVTRGAVPLGAFAEDPSGSLHDRVGWTIFLQELFGRPDLSSDDFYGIESIELEPSTRSEEADNVIELTQRIPSFAPITGEAMTVRGTIGGSPVAVAKVTVYDGVAREAFIRLALLAQGRMELARTAVREGIIRYPLDDPRVLNQRLSDAASKRVGDYVESLAGIPAGTVVVIGSARNSYPEQIARRLALPSAIADLMIGSVAPGQDVLRVGDGPVRQVLVLPELHGIIDQAPAAVSEEPTGDDHGGLYGRHHFESVFASDADPWQYTSQYEQKKYDQTLAMVPAENASSALEIGCAEGHFTAQLLPLVGSLVASDISEIALRRTAERFADSTNISFRQMDLARDPIEGTFDLIVCSEMLYYMGDRNGLAAVGSKLAGALNPGGALITAHANLVIDDPTAPGFDWRMPYGAKIIGETLAGTPGLAFEKGLQTSLYRIQRFRRERLTSSLPLSSAETEFPFTVEFAEHALPEPDVAKHILSAGGVVTEVANAVTTTRLPILMYHHVADSGSARLARWRVTPAQFSTQMRYLRQAGFKPATLAEWRLARREGKALAGRRFLITFDDGYADFEEHALPALRENGFPAVMFVPASHVGGRAVWDGREGEKLQLLDWDALRRIQKAGIVIGAHGSAHPYLTSLSIQDLVEELCSARTAIQRELGVAPDAIAYPFGDWDEAVARVAAACGYVHGLTTRESLSGLDEDGLSLSRIEVMGHETLEQFIAKLASTQPAASVS